MHSFPVVHNTSELKSVSSRKAIQTEDFAEESISDMITVLSRVLGGEVFFQPSVTCGLCQTNSLTDTCSGKCADASRSAHERTRPLHHEGNRNKFRSRRPQIVVHLFGVTSYSDGWPYSPRGPT